MVSDLLMGEVVNELKSNNLRNVVISHVATQLASVQGSNLKMSTRLIFIISHFIVLCSWDKHNMDKDVYCRIASLIKRHVDCVKECIPS